MSSPTIPPRAKLFTGIITNSDELLSRAEKVLIKKYGPVDFRTLKIPFTHTDYYKSIGTNLFKTFFSFEKLIKREHIVDIKLFTNKLEDKISRGEKRKINIDPGYLTLSNVYLASCKEYFHRTYLAKGIYLENEYRYVAKQFEFWDWTYPDYRKHEYLSFFYNIRKIYYNQIR
ncbi:MAG TPA: DUF4416 family protein [Spirochaetota bacterium]|nr:DUF4416 family protein [Spirochaetota bacterium]